MKKKKWDEEMVERISIKNVSAGYDINSIRNKKSKIHFYPNLFLNPYQTSIEQTY